MKSSAIPAALLTQPRTKVMSKIILPPLKSDLGTGHPVGIAVTGPESNAALLQPAAQILQTIGAGLVEPTADAERIRPLLSLGVPCFSPIQDDRFSFNYHHTRENSLDKVVPRQLQENAAVMAVLACTFANLPGTLEPPAPKPAPTF